MSYSQTWVRFKNLEAAKATFSDPTSVMVDIDRKYRTEPCFGSWGEDMGGQYCVINQFIYAGFTLDEIHSFYSCLKKWFPFEYRVVEVTKFGDESTFLGMTSDICSSSQVYQVHVLYNSDLFIQQFGNKSIRWWRLLFTTILRLMQEYPHVVRTALDTAVDTTPEALWEALFCVQRHVDTSTSWYKAGEKFKKEACDAGLSFCIEQTWTPTGHGVNGNNKCVLVDPTAMIMYALGRSSLNGIHAELDKFLTVDVSDTTWFKSLKGKK